MRERISPDHIPVTVSAFGVCSINDPVIYSPDPLILMVKNKADRTVSEDGSQRHGKPMGLGFPGGGMATEHFETNPEDAVIREVSDETGVHALSAMEYEEARIGKIIWKDKKTNNTSHIQTFPIGRRPAITYDSSKEVVEVNHWQLFRVRLDWEGSKLQKAFRKFKLYCEFNENDIADEGLCMPDFTDEQLQGLGIVEFEEVHSFALFTEKYLMEEYYRIEGYPEEDGMEVFNRSDRRSLFYRNHIAAHHKIYLPRAA